MMFFTIVFLLTMKFQKFLLSKRFRVFLFLWFGWLEKCISFPVSISNPVPVC